MDWFKFGAPFSKRALKETSAPATNSKEQAEEAIEQADPTPKAPAPEKEKVRMEKTAVRH
ncbi:hypothetical protein CRG98_015795 [Punica granatum]|uniref:Uncharacterized protein n=1 Tax=Punica granatum TaxID=22663 RepID=A0A2I0K5K8_PUNGR|nr:hypothetical protein CRG98_015795 [Punica granatum]